MANAIRQQHLNLPKICHCGSTTVAEVCEWACKRYRWDGTKWVEIDADGFWHWECAACGRQLSETEQERFLQANALPSQPQPLFTLGQIFMTPGAEAALEAADQSPFDFLARHLTDDWGEGLPPEDIQANQDALQHDLRLLSRYTTKQNTVIWVITEHDRSVTTVLLPNEY